MRTVKGASILVTKTGESKSPDGFIYVIDLLQDSYQIFINKMIPILPQHAQALLDRLLKSLEPSLGLVK